MITKENNASAVMISKKNSRQNHKNAGQIHEIMLCTELICSNRLHLYYIISFKSLGVGLFIFISLRLDI